MKLTTMLLIGVTFSAAIGSGAQGKPEGERRITVYLCDNNLIPFAAESQAQGLAFQTFKEIGVTLRWRVGTPPPSDTNAIAIEFVDHTPGTLMPGALAYALPYEGVHVRIFLDRVESSPFPRQILAFVMVHEITHILQALPRHSAEGIMKAHWTHEDHVAMGMGTLHFMPEDVDLIYRGMDARSARVLGPAVPRMTTLSVAATE